MLDLPLCVKDYQVGTYPPAVLALGRLGLLYKLTSGREFVFLSPRDLDQRIGEMETDSAQSG
jgi:hypothetical protein